MRCGNACTCEGFISMDEFEEACCLLGHHTASVIPREHVLAMARNMDLNKDGHNDTLRQPEEQPCQPVFLHKNLHTYKQPEEQRLQPGLSPQRRSSFMNNSDNQKNILLTKSFSTRTVR